MWLTSTKNCLRRPVKVSLSKMTDKVFNMVLAHQKIKVHTVLKATSIPQNTTFLVLNKKSSIKKIVAILLPQLLLMETKRNCVELLMLGCTNVQRR